MCKRFYPGTASLQRCLFRSRLVPHQNHPITVISRDNKLLWKVFLSFLLTSVHSEMTWGSILVVSSLKINYSLETSCHRKKAAVGSHHHCRKQKQKNQFEFVKSRLLGSNFNWEGDSSRVYSTRE